MLMKSCWLCKIVGALAIIGALNWGLIGVAEYNVVDHLLGAGSTASRVVYSLVGLSGLTLLASYFMACPGCDKNRCCDKNQSPEDKRQPPEDRRP